MLKQVNGQVCGRDYQVVQASVVHWADVHKARPRIYVDGLVKANGEHIRFKSLRKAENHIRNMRLVKG